MPGTDHDCLRSEGDLNLSPLRAQWMDGLDADTRRLLEEDAGVFLHQSLSTPCLNALEGCEGAYLIDTSGRRILDFHGNYVHQVGFGHPKVVAAVTRQLAELPFCTRRYTNARAIALARRLTRLAPGDLNRVLFVPGGAEAVSMALRLARAATGRHKTVSMWESFHGATLDAISVGGEAIFRRDIGPLMPGTEHVPPPDPTGCPFCEKDCTLACARYLEYVLEKEGDVAAVVAETVRCTPFIPPPEYWKRVRAACDRHGTLLILDEIPTCLGRTGKIFAFEHYGILPDMVVLGKGLGGGVFPLAALVAREELNTAMPERALGHFTHEKNPVAAAAALAVLDILEDDRVPEHAQHMGRFALEQLETLRAKHAFVGDVRGLGLLLGVELIHPETGARAMREAERVMYAALRRGLSFKVTMGNVLTLAPPLTITEREMLEAVRILDEALGETGA